MAETTYFRQIVSINMNQNLLSVSTETSLDRNIYLPFGRYLEYKIIAVTAIYSKKIVTHQM